MPAIHPGISLCVVAFQNEKQIENLLKDLLLQNEVSHIEVIVIDNAESSLLNQIILDFNIKNPPFECLYFKNTINNLGLARQKAVENSQFSQILFLDPDCIISKDWLAQIRYFLAENQITGAGAIHFGSLASAEKDSFFDVLFSLYSLSGLSKQVGFSTATKTVNHVPAMNTLYNKKTLLECGGFSEDFPLVGEDLFVSYLFRKSGIKMIYAPVAPVIHAPPQKLLNWSKKVFKYGYGQKLSFKKDSRSLRSMAFIPIIFFITFLLLLGLHWPLAIFIFISYLLFVFAEVLFKNSSRHLSIKTKLDLFVWVLVTHQSYLLGELFG